MLGPRVQPTANLSENRNVSMFLARIAAAADAGGPDPDDPQSAAVRACLREIAELFRSHFDQNWLLLLLERFPVDAVAMNEIRELMRHDAAFLEPDRLAARLALLEGYVQHLRRYLLPGLREKLGISGLLPVSRRVWEKEQVLLRRLVAYTFPFNLEHLERLASQLRQALAGFDERASA